jgi:hypothetical protein
MVNDGKALLGGVRVRGDGGADGGSGSDQRATLSGTAWLLWLASLSNMSTWPNL